MDNFEAHILVVDDDDGAVCGGGGNQEEGEGEGYNNGDHVGFDEAAAAAETITRPWDRCWRCVRWWFRW